MWDAVLPSLRGVAVHVDYPSVRSRFLYETVGGKELVVTEDIETLIIADFPSDIDVRCVAEEVPTGSPRSLRDGEGWVFLRYEESSAGPIE